mgnify:CR=1 FL=1|jgi:hypothetical protein|nr:MAG TPA: hypothetical protein [Caudoviricetes sp.]
MQISKLLENLITKKFYKNKEEANAKLAVFYAVNQITDQEYTTLTLKVEEVYTEQQIELLEREGK